MLGLLEMEDRLQNCNLNKICDGKFKPQMYATWLQQDKESQNGVSYISVTYSSKSVPFHKAKTSKCIEDPSACGFRLSTADNMRYQLLQWPDDHLGTIFSTFRKCPSNSKD